MCLKVASETNFYEFEVGRGTSVILGWELMIWMQDTKVSEKVFRYFGILDTKVNAITYINRFNHKLRALT